MLVDLNTQLYMFEGGIAHCVALRWAMVQFSGCIAILPHGTVALLCGMAALLGGMAALLSGMAALLACWKKACEV